MPGRPQLTRLGGRRDEIQFDVHLLLDMGFIDPRGRRLKKRILVCFGAVLFLVGWAVFHWYHK